MYPSRYRIAFYAVIIILGCLIALPNLLPKSALDDLPGWLPQRQVTLGLDLKGGSHLVLEIDGPALAKDQLDTLRDSVRVVVRGTRVPGVSITSANDTVTVRVADANDREAVQRALRTLVGSVGSNLFGAADPDIEVVTAANGDFTVRRTSAGVIASQRGAIEQSLEIVRRRIDEVGVAEPTIQGLGADRILVQLPGVQDPKRIKTLLGSTAKLTFHRVSSEPDGDARQRAPGGYVRMPDATGRETHVIERQAMLQGDRLTQAAAGFDHMTNEPVVTFRLDAIGAKRFGEITRDNVGRPFAIVLDGKVLSAPVIREPIIGGSGQISGNFTAEETTQLAALLRAGALPVPLKVIEERTVGADLGSDAIRMGAMTGVAGFGLVCLFMVVLYGRWGLVANLALGLNVALTFAALTLLGATLTLPGIAGIVLGIGLAVDANVLINERIREETRAGRSAVAALDAGFSRAYATIVDSNLTALIATLLLFWFGSGPVRGFAVTMALGIAISMFTAVSVVKAIMALWVYRRRPKVFAIEPLFRFKLFNDEPNIPFMKARRFGIAMSVALSLAAVVLLFKPGLNYGVDFKGGSLIEIKTEQPADLARLRGALNGLGLGEVALQEFGDPTTTLVRVEMQPGDEAAQMTAIEAVKTSIVQLEPGANFARVEIIGPKVSGELARAGILAVVFASLAMLAYIWVRFEWQFAVGAIATLVLDVTKTVGFLALTGLDFSLTAIAAVLTLIGYSVNDKVVVYDRMRENLRRYKSMPLRELIDLSINQTLARSLYTSVTAFLALLPMAIWGGSAVESFAVPMLFGIVIAASSSVFIAAPILLFLGEKKLRRKPAQAATDSVQTTAA